MQLTIKIDSSQVIEAAEKMPLDDKLRLFDNIKNDIIRYRFESILTALKTDELSENDILKEVEDVRKERFNNRH
jgi:hypothetical protein